jgi:hypothetical protein
LHITSQPWQHEPNYALFVKQPACHLDILLGFVFLLLVVFLPATPISLPLSENGRITQAAIRVPYTVSSQMGNERVL